jgi:tRNA(Arg) A34 adenosine deaminase TadA
LLFGTSHSPNQIAFVKTSANNPPKYRESFLTEAFTLAVQSVTDNQGGPFGAVVVLDNQVIGRGVNRVTTDNDPTAHAEVVAIRDACKNLNNFSLTGAVIYTTCEPCPMCFSAIYWANIETVFFASTRQDAANIGFRDDHIYEEIKLEPHHRKAAFHMVEHPMAGRLFNIWQEKQDKIPY